MKKSTILAMLTACLLSSPAFSGNYKIGVENTDYMPLYRGDTATYSGYARELLDAFGKKYGHTFSYYPYPMVTLFDEFAIKKSLDFKFPDNPYWVADAKKGIKINGMDSSLLKRHRCARLGSVIHQSIEERSPT